MMRASKKPAVGHNLSLDLAFTLAAFAQPLPFGWPEYKLLVAKWCSCPAMYTPCVWHESIVSKCPKARQV